MAVPKTSERPIAAATLGSPAVDELSTSPTEAKPWGWFILSLLALSISVGLNFFLGWVNWGFRQRYETLLDRFHSSPCPDRLNKTFLRREARNVVAGDST